MNSSDAPPSPMFGPDDPAVLACLAAARQLGLILRYAMGICKHSPRFANEGWWGRKSYGASMELGGPWTVEFVGRMCELGLLSMDPTAANTAAITKAGRALLKERLGKALMGNRKAGNGEPAQ